MKNLAPQIYRQRLIIEGYYGKSLDRPELERFLVALAARLGLRAYGAPAVYSPAGAGSPQNQGFDAFLPLVDSGISVYVWTAERFASVLVYSCRPFDPQTAIACVREMLVVEGEVASAAF